VAGMEEWMVVAVTEVEARGEVLRAAGFEVVA
jgi:hypothetical protein